MGAGLERHSAVFGKEESLPDTGGGQSEFAFLITESLLHRVGQPVGIENAPQPDVRIEQQPYLIEGFPFREIRRRSDEVSMGLTPILHRAQPISCRIRWWRDDFGNWLAEPGHEHGPPSLSHPVENRQTGRLELRNLDLFHGIERTMV